MMHQIMVLGAGKIGSLIASLLSLCGDYHVHLIDIRPIETIAGLPELLNENLVFEQLDCSDPSELDGFIKQQPLDAMVSCLPYFANRSVANAAIKHQLHYFDLTEDTEETRHVVDLSVGQSKALVPQCGLAPGFISIVANHLMEGFDELETVKMRVGALPINQNNTLKYSLTWSTDGLINEYGNTCYGIENHRLKELLPLEGYETISIDGLPYEAFNTSGGLGTLADSYNGQVKTMNYKTLRYPGHCEMVRLLMNDLKLNEDRQTLKRILENAVPKSMQDVVIIYVSVTGLKETQLYEENYVKKVYPKIIAGKHWSAIQVTTASGLCAVLDLVLSGELKYSGLVKQEDIEFDVFINNRFGKNYQ